MAAGPHISLVAEKIGYIYGIPITNSILMTWFTMALLIIFSLFATRKIKMVPSTIQSIAEIIIDGLHGLFTSVVGSHYVDRFFPLLATIFLFIIVANWGGLLPGVGTVGLFKEVPVHEIAASNETVTPAVVKESTTKEPSETLEITPVAANTSNTDENKPSHAVTETTSAEKPKTEEEFTPLLRGATADLNTTFALAIIAVWMIQVFGIQSLGLGYFKKFLNFSNPIMFAIGLLEIVSEISRIISFAFRLFGNIFAGEVLLTVIAFLMPLIAPLPFLGLELFVGFIQALVFSMLTAVFLNMATVSHDSH
jgi:F-type H+-transporting ATPase subunit a